MALSAEALWALLPKALVLLLHVWLHSKDRRPQVSGHCCQRRDSAAPPHVWLHSPDRRPQVSGGGILVTERDSSRTASRSGQIRTRAPFWVLKVVRNLPSPSEVAASTSARRTRNTFGHVS
eukprot:3368908-Pyramimonas_sp.AAC.1